MPSNDLEVFRKHSENLKEIRKNLVQLERVHKDQIRAGHSEAEVALRRSHFLAVGIFAEAVLRKIISDPTGFNGRERKAIWATRSQLDRWVLTVELAFRRHNDVLFHENLSPENLGTKYAQYEEINLALAGDLRALIEDRNKFAHGQWLHFLQSGKEDVFSREAPTPPTYTKIVAQYKATSAIAAIVHTLAVSDPAFQRDYTEQSKKFQFAVERIRCDNYATFVRQLRKKRPS